VIVEYIRYQIPGDHSAAFEDAYRAAATSLEESPHCRRYEVARCTEDPAAYTVRIEWDSLDAHMNGFRSSPQFRTFFAAVQPFVDAIEEMRHYEITDASAKETADVGGS
jgi:quinol monooxygenase YgiN